MMPSLRATRRAVLVVAALAAGSGDAAAQICMEMPITAAGFGFAAHAMRAPGRSAELDGQPGTPAVYALGFRGAHDPVGPLALGLAYTRSSFDHRPDTVTISARHHHAALRAAYQLTAGALEACPLVEVGWFSFERDAPDERAFSGTGLFAAAGWTFEGSFDAGSLRVSPFVTPSLLIVRNSGRRDYYGYEDGPEILPKVAARFGVYAADGRVFAGAHWETVFPGSDPRFWLMGATADERPANSVALTAGIRF